MSPGGITYLKGDATSPQAKGVKLICHVCNDLGGWGKGFVLAVSRRWAAPEEEYRAWHAGRSGNDFELGAVQFVQVEPYVWVANMIAQRGVKQGSRWAAPEEEYRAWHAGRSGNDFELGAVQFVQVEPYVWVANMIAQRGVKQGSSGPPIRYAALAECLRKVGDKALELGASVHMPRIGCGLAGGKWSEVEPLIEEHLCARGVKVTVYDYE